MGVVGIVHAMMQLGVSVLTLLSGHSLGSKRAHSRLLRLNFGYIIGAFVVAALMVASLSFLIQSYFWLIPLKTMFIGLSVLAIISSLSIIRFYYRKSPGTLLWIPRGLAEYLTNRAKRTRNSFEAGALGAMTVVMELPFTFALFLIVSVFMIFISPDLRLWITLGYAFITVLPLLVITSLVGGGHRLSTIQRWREDNKYFLQYASSFGLLAITLFIILYYVKGVA
jgi:hypothetical protein